MTSRSIGVSAVDGLVPSAGDARALPWNELIRRHERRVLVALLAHGVPLERAKELTQETWLRLIQQRAAGKLRRLELPGVAIKQAVFLALDDRRRHARRGAILSLDDDELDFERRMVAREQLRVVERVLARSSKRARRVFRLLYGEPPRSAAEVATALGISLQRTRQIVCELRKRIRRELEAGR